MKERDLDHLLSGLYDIFLGPLGVLTNGPLTSAPAYIKKAIDVYKDDTLSRIFKFEDKPGDAVTGIHH